MKTYTFFYYDSIYDFRSDKRSEFVVTASRFPVAFKAFCDFVTRSCFYFFAFLGTYKICSDSRISCRVLSSKYYYILDKMKRMPND